MIDSIGSSTSVGNSQRSQASSQTTGLRSVDVLNAVQQKSQKTSGATAPVKVFAVPQTAKSGNAATTKLPRGTLLDVLA